MRRLTVLLALALLALPSGSALTKEKRRSSGFYCVKLLTPPKPSVRTPRVAIAFRVDGDKGRIGTLLSAVDVGDGEKYVPPGFLPWKDRDLKIDRRGRFSGRDRLWTWSGVFVAPRRIKGTIRLRWTKKLNGPGIDTGFVRYDARPSELQVEPGLCRRQ